MITLNPRPKRTKAGSSEPARTFNAGPEPSQQHLCVPERPPQHLHQPLWRPAVGVHEREQLAPGGGGAGVHLRGAAAAAAAHYARTAALGELGGSAGWGGVGWGGAGGLGYERRGAGGRVHSVCMYAANDQVEQARTHPSVLPPSTTMISSGGGCSCCRALMVSSMPFASFKTCWGWGEAGCFEGMRE